MSAAELRSKAESGDANAMAELATAHYTGQNADQDFEQALAWYQKAAEQGNTWSQYMVGVMAQEGQGRDKDLGEARTWYERAAQSDLSLAILNLGIMYQLGLGVDIDMVKAAEYYERAASQDNMRAAMNLASLHHVGAITGEPDYKQALHFYERAGELGADDAAELIGQVKRIVDPKSAAREAVTAYRKKPVSLWDRLIGRR